VSDGAKIAICPGTYDPVTFGHIDVIHRVAQIFDRVIVAVVHDPLHKAGTLFEADERVSFLEQALADDANVSIETFGELLVDFARRHDAHTIVKGLRAISDFEYEMEMNQLNRMQRPDIDTLYLMASPQYSFLSSSGVKELAMFDGKIDDLVPERVARRLKEELAR